MQKEKDDFDKLFLKWADYFVQESLDSIGILENSSYLGISYDARRRGCFCHHDQPFNIDISSYPFIKGR